MPLLGVHSFPKTPKPQNPKNPNEEIGFKYSHNKLYTLKSEFLPRLNDDSIAVVHVQSLIAIYAHLSIVKFTLDLHALSKPFARVASGRPVRFSDEVVHLVAAARKVCLRGDLIC